MSPFHFCLSAAMNLSSFQLLPASLITDLLQLFLGLPLFLFPWGFQSSITRFNIRKFIFVNKVEILLYPVLPNFRKSAAFWNVPMIRLFVLCVRQIRGYAVAQLVEVLLYKRLRFPIVSLEFFIDIILPVALWPWGLLSLWQKWVPGVFRRG